MIRIIVPSILILSTMSFSVRTNIHFYEAISRKIDGFVGDFDQIPKERMEALQGLAHFIMEKKKAGEKAELIFICTHNSRRSQMAQIWASTAAASYGMSDVVAYSGGTEATAFNPRAIEAMQKAGFKISQKSGGSNPTYEVRFADDGASITTYSKKYDDNGNPKKGFAAILTCSQADQNCPLVSGASFRAAIPYDDPKEFDGTSLEASKYAERADQIGREMFYAFSLVKQ